MQYEEYNWSKWKTLKKNPKSKNTINSQNLSDKKIEATIPYTFLFSFPPKILLPFRKLKFALFTVFGASIFSAYRFKTY